MWASFFNEMKSTCAMGMVLLAGAREAYLPVPTFGL